VLILAGIVGWVLLILAVATLPGLQFVYQRAEAGFDDVAALYLAEAGADRINWELNASAPSFPIIRGDEFGPVYENQGVFEGTILTLNESIKEVRVEATSGHSKKIVFVRLRLNEATGRWTPILWRELAF